MDHITKEQCREFHENCKKGIFENPITERPIKKGAGTYNKLMDACKKFNTSTTKGKTPKSKSKTKTVIIPTERECRQFAENCKINPKTKKKITKSQKLDFQKACLQYSKILVDDKNCFDINVSPVLDKSITIEDATDIDTIDKACQSKTLNAKARGYYNKRKDKFCCKVHVTETEIQRQKRAMRLAQVLLDKGLMRKFHKKVLQVKAPDPSSTTFTLDPGALKKVFKIAYQVLEQAGLIIVEHPKLVVLLISMLLIHWNMGQLNEMMYTSERIVQDLTYTARFQTVMDIVSQMLHVGLEGFKFFKMSTWASGIRDLAMALPSAAPGMMPALMPLA